MRHTAIVQRIPFALSEQINIITLTLHCIVGEKICGLQRKFAILLILFVEQQLIIMSWLHINTTILEQKQSTQSCLKQNKTKHTATAIWDVLLCVHSCQHRHFSDQSNKLKMIKSTECAQFDWVYEFVFKTTLDNHHMIMVRPNQRKSPVIISCLYFIVGKKRRLHSIVVCLFRLKSRVPIFCCLFHKISFRSREIKKPYCVCHMMYESKALN